MSDDLISRRALYERAATLEAQALDYVGKLIERDGEETSVEWRIWSAILTERTAFKHDVYDAPSAQPKQKKGKWVHGKEIAREYLAGRITHIEYKDYHCSECGYTVENIRWNVDGELVDKYCTVCGAQMEVENDE